LCSLKSNQDIPMPGWTSGAGLLALLAVDAAFAAVSSVVDDGYMRRPCFCRDLWIEKWKKESDNLSIQIDLDPMGPDGTMIFFFICSLVALLSHPISCHFKGCIRFHPFALHFGTWKPEAGLRQQELDGLSTASGVQDGGCLSRCRTVEQTCSENPKMWIHSLKPTWNFSKWVSQIISYCTWQRWHFVFDFSHTYIKP
jgi:hypothetical protein